MSSRRELVVRSARERDSAALASLLSESTGLATTAAQAIDRLRKSRGLEHPYIAELDGEVAGFASVRLLPYLGEDRPYAEVSELFVFEHFRRQRVGAALLAALEAHARTAGASALAVITSQDSAAAFALYQSRGLEPFALALQKWFSDERPFKLKER